MPPGKKLLQPSFLGSALQNNYFGAWPFLQNPPTAPVDGLGGAKDRNTPFITGAGNRKNQWGPFPYICGHVRVYPPYSASFRTAIDSSGQYASGILTFGYGQIHLQYLYVGDQQWYEVEGFNWTLLPGAEAGETQNIYHADSEQTEVSYELIAGKDTVVSAPQEATYIELELEFYNGLQRVTGVVDSNDVVHYQKSSESVTYEVYVRTVGSTPWTHVSAFTITDNTEVSVRRSITFTVTQELYEIRIVRQTADSNDPGIINGSRLVTVRAYKPGDPIRPFYTQKGNRVLISHLAWFAKAGQKTNGAIGEISGLVYRMIPVKVGDAWVVSDTQNPADYFINVLTGQAFDEQVTLEDIDLESVMAWRQVCQDAGYKINYVFDSEQEIEQVLSLICKTGRAKWFIKDGKYSVVYDGVRTTQVQTFTERNSRDYSGEKAHPIISNALAVRFLNEQTEFKEDVRIVYWPGYGPDSTNLIVEEMDMPGVTHPDLVYEHGMYELAVMRYRPETHTVTTDLQHLTCNQGDLVRLVNRNALLGLGSALITEVQTNGGGDVTHVVVDQPLPMLEGSSYDFEIRLSDGTFMTRTLVTVEGEYDTFEFAEPIPFDADLLPAEGDMVAYGVTGEIGALQIVQEIQHQPGMEATITMQPYSPEIFSAASGPIPPFDTNVTAPHDSLWQLPKPTYRTVRSDENVLLRMSNGSLQSRIVVAMNLPSDLRVTHFQLEYKLADSERWLPGESVRVEHGQVELRNVEDGQTYSLQVRHYAEPGKASEWVRIPDHKVIGKTTPPPNINSLLRITGSNILKAGVPPLPPDYAGLRWFYNLGSSRIRSRALAFANLVTSDQIDISLLPKTVITVGVVMVDVIGLESKTPAWATIENGRIDTSNVVVEHEYHPTFPGSHNGVVADSKLKAQDSGGIMWNANGNAPMWSADGDAVMWTDTYEDLMWTFPYTPDFSYADKDFRLIMRYGQELIVNAPQGYKFEYRRIGSSLMWSGDGDSPMWSEDGDSPMWDSADPKAPWTGELDGRVEELELTLTLFGGSSQPWVEEATMKVDVPDVVATIDDAVISNAGSRLSLPVAFRFIRNCNVTLQYSGDHPDAFTWRVVDKDPVSGPLIEVLDSSGNLTSGIVDATLRGY